MTRPPKRFVCLLRAVNVSGKNKVPMKELKSRLELQAFEDVTTYLQSGNVVLSSAQDRAEIEGSVRAVIKEHFELDISVLVFEQKDFFDTVQQHPFKNQDPSKLHITFFQGPPEREKETDVRNARKGDEQVEVVDSCSYLYCPDGYGRTKLNNGFLERKLKVTATTRNWKTCQKLIDLSS